MVVRDLHSADESALVDLLSEYTIRLSKLFSRMITEPEYIECKKAIEEIALEIENRRLAQLPEIKPSD